MKTRSFEHREYLIDVSRLIWRAMSGRLPTGIDRVCLAYIEHFGARAQAVIQRNGHYLVINPTRSDDIFCTLQAMQQAPRTALLRSLALAIFGVRRAPPRPNMIYLNVGHTGLNELSLLSWIRRTQLRGVYMVHDLIPMTHPQYCRPAEAAKHVLRIEHALASAAGIIANSQSTLNEVKQYALANRLTLPPAIAAWISGPSPHKNTGKSLMQEPYFVMVGTIEGRKNHAMILRIWSELVAERGEQAPALVIIGQRGWKAEEAIAILDRADIFRGRVLQFDRCGDEELTNWLSGATALLMPSFAEGFGLPVIEALQLGTPVIASDLTVFREISGSIPTFIAPSNKLDWKTAIQQFVSGGTEQKRQLAAVQHYQAPNWPSHFALVESWLNAL